MAPPVCHFPLPLWFQGVLALLSPPSHHVGAEGDADQLQKVWDLFFSQNTTSPETTTFSILFYTCILYITVWYMRYIYIYIYLLQPLQVCTGQWDQHKHLCHQDHIVYYVPQLLSHQAKTDKQDIKKTLARTCILFHQCSRFHGCRRYIWYQTTRDRGFCMDYVTNIACGK